MGNEWQVIFVQPATEEQMKRYGNPCLKSFLEKLSDGLPEDFVEASDHKYDCTCDKCREWWRSMGPDPETGMYGPFGDALVGEDKLTE